MQNSMNFMPPQQPQTNPLSMFMRQPKIYIQLPSKGEYWPAGSLQMPADGKLPVYSMTAKDELLLNVPDALMNGQAVVDVIQNCIPNIKNAWMVPSIDMDALLISIRIATYGEMMVSPVKVSDEIEMDYKVDLRIVLDGIMDNSYWDPVISINDQMTVFVKPLNYRQASVAALQTFETQKIMQLTNNETIDEETKLKMFKDSFKKLTDSTVGMISDSIARIDTAQGSTDNPVFIKEFLDNVDKDIFNTIQEHLNVLKEKNSIKPAIVPVTPEMKEKGIKGETIEVPLVFDASTFFV